MVLNKKPIIIKTLFILFCLFVLAVAVFYSLLISGRWGNVPSKQELREIKNHLASEIYSDNGELIGKYFYENRSNVSFEEIPPVIVDALIATEDIRFFEHEGIDRKSLLRVLVKTLVLGDKSSGGGSTISQQLIKNLFPRIGNTFLNLSVSKFKEMVAAKRLEDIYSKQEILTLYLNTVPFGDNTFGIESAADHYFSKTLQELSLGEVATLIGMLKGTGLYNPYYNPENSLKRRNVVLHQMQKYGYINKSLVDSLENVPMEVNYKVLSHHSGLAPYFREQLRNKMQKWCDEFTGVDGETYDLFKDGLKIYTTIDADLQRNAEKAMNDHMKKLQMDFNKHWQNRKPWSGKPSVVENAIKNSPRYKRLVASGVSSDSINLLFKTPIKRKIFSWDGEKEMIISPLDSILYNLQILHAGILAMSPKDGAVKAWVGGINHKYYQYDHVLSKRQVGSTFKPFVYAAALKKGIRPNDFYRNDSIVYKDYDNWTPANSDNTYGGEYSVLGGLVKSVNTVSVQLAMDASLNSVTQMASNLGVKTEIPSIPSIALGSVEIPLIEMVTAYAPFANGGFRVEPNYISRIEDRDGNVLAEFKASEPVRVIDENLALKMAYMLKMVVDSGTARSLRSHYGLNYELAGKTGTTQNHADGWFIVFTPKLLTGIWVGAEYPSIHFRTGAYGQGAYMALPIFANMAKGAGENEIQDYYSDWFKLMNREMANQFACDLYRESPRALEKIERFIDMVGDIFRNNKKPDIKQDTVPEKRGFFKRIGDIFKKK